MYNSSINTTSQGNQSDQSVHLHLIDHVRLLDLRLVQPHLAERLHQVRLLQHVRLWAGAGPGVVRLHRQGVSMTQLIHPRDPSVPTLSEVDFALKRLKIVMASIETQQNLNRLEMQNAVKVQRYGLAAQTQDQVTGLMAAYNLVHLEMDQLKHLRHQVELYEKSLASQWFETQGSLAAALTGEVK